MAEFDRDLDLAIDRLHDRDRGRRPPVPSSWPTAAEQDQNSLDELVGLASRLRYLPAEQWPDPTFADRLVDDVRQRLPIEATGISVRWNRLNRATRAWRQSSARWVWVGTAAAAAALAVVLTVSPVTPFGPTTQVSAQVLASKASALSAGRGLPPVRFTEVVTTYSLPAYFEPAPPPPTVIQQVTFAEANRWRSDATVVNPHNAGTVEVLTVRNGTSIVQRMEGTGMRRPSVTVITGQAGVDPGLPTASTYGIELDPASLLALTTGRCARPVALAGTGPTIAGRPTKVLRLGSNPCPSAAVPEIDGPATFWIDARTSLVLRAEVFAPNGQLFEQATITQLRYGGTFPPSLFQLPTPPPKHPTTSPSTTLPSTLPGLGQLRTNMAYPPLVPSRLPAGMRQGAIQPVGGDPDTGKIESFTITYNDPEGHPALQFYEAPAASPSVHFPGQSVTITPAKAGRQATVGTLNASPGWQILWWIQGTTYCSLQEGGAASGVTLSDTLTAVQLIQIAATTS
jgi:hypothetical protein